MCGIIGYVGPKTAEPLLVEGLRRVEYRGYDSTGLGTLMDGQLHLRKRAGRVAQLTSLLRERPAPGTVGISHTRWATHGPATDQKLFIHRLEQVKIEVAGADQVREVIAVLQKQGFEQAPQGEAAPERLAQEVTAIGGGRVGHESTLRDQRPGRRATRVV